MNTPDTATAAFIVKNFLRLKAWNSLPIVIMLLMLQNIHPNIIHELLPHFQMKHRQVRDIILAMMQLRLFSSFFLLDIRGVRECSYEEKRRMIQQNPQHRVSRLFNSFRSRVFTVLMEKGGFKKSLEYTGHPVRNFIANFIVFRMNPIFPFPRLFWYEDADLICIKTACEMNTMISRMRSSYPGIFSLIAHNEIAFENIILVWKTQMCIKEKRYYKSRNHCYMTYSDNITDHPINDLFIFCMLAITHTGFIDKKILFFIKNFGDRSKQLEDSCDLKHLKYLWKNCKTSELKFLEPSDGIWRVIGAFSRMPNSEGAHGVKYELQPATAASGIYQIDKSKFECLTMEVDRQQPMVYIFTKFLEVFLRNFARTFEESGGRTAVQS